MSADAVPAAVPNPNDPPATSTADTPATGLLASMLAPVVPVHTAAFSLDPQAADSTPATGAELPATGTSSAAFHGNGDGQNDTSGDTPSKGTGKQEKGIWRAWMLAGAARWARGGGTQNKRLDMKKARAAAHQVKESRQVSVNKSGGLGGGTGGGRSSNASGAGGSKSLSSKSPKGTGPTGGGSAKGPKNSSGSGGGAGRGPAVRDSKRSTDKPGAGPKGSGGAGGGRGTSGGTSSDSKGPGPAPKKQTPAKTDTPAPKPSKTAPVEQKNSKPSPAAGSANGGKGAAGSAGKDGASPKPGAAPKGATTTPNSGATKDTKETPASTDRKKWSLTKGDKTAKGGTTTPPATADGTKPDTGKSKTDPKTTPDKPKTDTAAGPKPATKDTKPFTTRPARETGYRDGTRAATVASHAKAYRDGVRDGWADTSAAADREKARLDQAHEARKETRDKEQPVTTTASSADYHQPQPIAVTGIDSTHLHLGAGAMKPSVTRGEVRTLKGFERRLDAKTDVMTQVADTTKALRAHAEEQAKKATRLLEAAKAVQGGDKLAGDLAKLADAATVQSGKAGEIHKRAVRATEACRVVLANVETRYGGMYKAVVDSDETAPAELTFYKG